MSKIDELVQALVAELQESPDTESVLVSVTRTPSKSDGIVVRAERQAIDRMDWRWRESDWFGGKRV